MTPLARVIHGSKLYGLDGPQSDTDYKGLFLPGMDECLLMSASQSQNQSTGEGASKVEYESFSLQRFLKLAANGEDCAITMLHVSPQHVLEDSPIYRTLRDNRSRFYTKRLKGSLGYAMNHAMKHGLRADRLVAVERVIVALEQAEAKGVGRLYQCWDDLPDGEHIVRTTNENNRDGVDKRIYEVAGKGLPATISPAYGLGILTKLRDQYGNRVRAAKQMSGHDFKALSHSFRVGYQLREIYQRGGFLYPLDETPFLRDVKEGCLNYVDDRLGERLDELIAEVERLAEASTYPERTDPQWMSQMILEAYSVPLAEISKAAIMKALSAKYAMGHYPTTA